MLNYIWLGLILLGVLVAVVTDWHDLATDKYLNDAEYLVNVVDLRPLPLEQGKISAGRVVYFSHFRFEGPGGVVRERYDVDLVNNDRTVQPQRCEITPNDPHTGTIRIFLDNNPPSRWADLLKAQKKSDYLLARIHWDSLNGFAMIRARLKFDPVRFVKMNDVTNDGIISSAKTAVELSIGLIGIMALWLGVMKIAEQSGLVAKLAALLKPVTRRLFPDVPPDHPAMGAMIMNIAANMLGLANAATPLGLKAMDELNKLNPKAGTATDAMCTFLVINTSNVQLIPATVIALRAASGSANPTEIIGPVLIATVISLVLGVTIVKLLARLPVYRRQLETGS